MESKYWFLLGALVIGTIWTVIGYCEKLNEHLDIQGEDSGINTDLQESEKRQEDYKLYIALCKEKCVQAWPDHQDFFFHWKFLVD